MITIHQIRLTDEQIDMINAKGHDSVPAQKAKLDVMFGAKGFKKENFQYYTPVYEVKTDDLEKAFDLTNVWQDRSSVRIISGTRGYSSSVGDIFETNGKFYMVDTFGFEEVEVA